MAKPNEVVSKLTKFASNEANKGKFFAISNIKDPKAFIEAGFVKNKDGVAISYENAVKFLQDLHSLMGDSKSLETEEQMFELEIQEDGTAVLTAEDVTKIQELVADGEKAVETIEGLENAKTELESANAKLTNELEDLKARMVELEADDDKDEDEDEEPTEREAALLERIVKLEREGMVSKVDAVIEKAKNYVDNDGRGHSAAFLNGMRALMLLENLQVGDETIKLEDATNAAAIGKHVRTIAEALLTTVPGQQLVESKTAGDDGKERLEEGNEDGKNEAFDKGKGDGKSFWAA